MKYRIALWSSARLSSCGLLGTFCLRNLPSNKRTTEGSLALVSLTCPVAIAGRHYPISLYETLAANAVTYALVGLIVETLRHQLHHAK
jgi:cation transporter-like permease